MLFDCQRPSGGHFFLRLPVSARYARMFILVSPMVISPRPTHPLKTPTSVIDTIVLQRWCRLPMRGERLGHYLSALVSIPISLVRYSCRLAYSIASDIRIVTYAPPATCVLILPMRLCINPTAPYRSQGRAVCGCSRDFLIFAPSVECAKAVSGYSRHYLSATALPETLVK